MSEPATYAVPAVPARTARDAAHDVAARHTAAAFVDLLATGWSLALPGSGLTAHRWQSLTALGRTDLALARLAEGHADAVAILTELDESVPAGRLGVWAAEPPNHRVTAVRDGDRWRLTGAKAWCSGAHSLTAALVTARDGEDRRLFLLDLAAPGVRVRDGDWASAGMAGSDTGTVDLAAVTARPIGGPGAYLDRPGFWHGGIGVAAVWVGGARRVADTLLHAAGPADALQDAALGAVEVALAGAEAALHTAAAEVDTAPDDVPAARLRAMRVRALAARAADDVLTLAARALGAGPLATDARHAQHVADLGVYLRQHHGDRDLAALGALLREQASA